LKKQEYQDNTDRTEVCALAAKEMGEIIKVEDVLISEISNIQWRSNV